MKQSIFFSTGDPSGDQHAGRVIASMRQRDPNLCFRGFGGPQMLAAGCKLDFELTQLAVMGAIEVAPKLAQFYKVANQAKSIFQQGNTQAVVLVDFPGFNWHIAKRAKACGIPVFYYLPPQLWAWAPWRLSKVRRYVDKVLSVLPFEYEWYQERGIDTEYVGHPFFDAVLEKQLDARTLGDVQQLKSQGKRIVAVLPGSRSNEVSGNWPLQLEAIRRLHAKHPDVHFLVAAFRDKHCLTCRSQLTEDDRSLPIDFYVGKTSEVIEAAQCAIMVSGSVSLELMARRTPAVVLYRLGRVFHTIATTLANIDSITLPNLIAGKTIFPEFLSVGNPEPAIANVVTATDRMLSQPDYLAQVNSQLDALRQKYAMPGATATAAECLIRLIHSRDLSSPSNHARQAA